MASSTKDQLLALLASLDCIASTHDHLSPELKADLARHRADLDALVRAQNWVACSQKAVQVAVWVKLFLDLWNGSDPP